jgi:hypothetical protein
MKNRLKYEYDKIHGRVVVVVQKYLKKGWLFDFLPFLREHIVLMLRTVHRFACHRLFLLSLLPLFCPHPSTLN